MAGTLADDTNVERNVYARWKRRVVLFKTTTVN